MSLYPCLVARHDWFFSHSFLDGSSEVFQFFRTIRTTKFGTHIPHGCEALSADTDPVQKRTWMRRGASVGVEEKEEVALVLTQQRERVGRCDTAVGNGAKRAGEQGPPAPRVQLTSPIVVMVAASRCDRARPTVSVSAASSTRI